MTQKPDPMNVLSQEKAQGILDGAWYGMVETETHLIVRRFLDGPDGPVEGIVIVARGEAARLLSVFTPTIPSFGEGE